MYHRQSYNLFLRVLVGAQQVDGLHVSKVDVMAQQEDEEQLADVLLLAVAVQSLVALELGADVGQLLVNPLDLCLFAFTWGHTNRPSAFRICNSSPCPGFRDQDYPDELLQNKDCRLRLRKSRQPLRWKQSLFLNCKCGPSTINGLYAVEVALFFS